MASIEPTEADPALVRTTGLSRESPRDERAALRARVAELESELERKEAVLAERNEAVARLRGRLDRREQALAEREADLEAARSDLEQRVESIESRSLLDRLRALF